MKTAPIKLVLLFGALFIIISLACGAVSPTEEPTQPPVVVQDPTDTPVPPPPEEPTPEEPPTVEEPEDTGAVSSLGDVKLAVVQIEAEGTFVDPEVGWEVNVGKRGSGVIIDPSGIAVTNNHVVTGAAILRVWVAGEDEPYNAKILGVSECSDLAVIDIEGEGFNYLEWYPEDVNVGLDVYAAGFPLGDPEYTLTEGIVSKESADGETSWASVNYVIEHTAKINPGNSGGPLITTDGKLVAINYSIVAETDQNYAISRDEALPVINELRAGNDVDSIGINGGAVSGYVGDTPVYGIWVRSVASGSPANQAGIEPGDIVYQLENEVLATDGTMADYCDVLRSRNLDDTMAISVIRWDDLSLHEGQLNGEELEFAGFLSDEDTGTEGGDTGDTGDTGATGDMHPNCLPAETLGYIECMDETFTILVEVPDYWTDYNGWEWVLDDEIIGAAITAAPSIDEFNNYWDAEGVFFGASDTFAEWGGYIQFLDIYSEDYVSGCDFVIRDDYDDGLYRGKYDEYEDCGGAGGFDTYVLAAVPIDDPSASIILVIVQVFGGDIDTVTQIWNTFLVLD
jgi:serine protease Do